MTVYYIPIEPLEERYTSQWYRWFPEEFRRQGSPCIIIDGEPLLRDRIEVGTFLDVNSTLHYKATQLRKIAYLFNDRVIKDGDVFFVADVEFWGIESIKYLATLNKVDVRICGFAHAGSYTREDFMEPCADFAIWYERGWGSVFDVIFVGSEYHKSMLIEKRNIPFEKIEVTGNPYDFEDDALLRYATPKVDRIIHTNRPDHEKRPLLTLEVFRYLSQSYPEWEFMVTTGRKQWGEGHTRRTALRMQDDGILKIREGISKSEYLTLLSESQVMTGNSIEENFGYCILEALIVDTMPVLPNWCSHPELVQADSRCLFDDMGEQVNKIIAAMEQPFAVFEYAERYRDSLKRIVSRCLET